jgi:hypothetical protein
MISAPGEDSRVLSRNGNPRGNPGNALPWPTTAAGCAARCFISTAGPEFLAIPIIRHGTRPGPAHKKNGMAFTRRRPTRLEGCAWATPFMSNAIR